MGSILNFIKLDKNIVIKNRYKNIIFGESVISHYISSPFFSKNTHSHTHKTYARDDVFVLFFAAAATARNGDDSAVVFFRRSMRFRGGNRAVPARQSVLRELSVPEKRGFLPMERGRGYFRRVF